MTPDQHLKAIKADLRRRGYRPAPNYRDGEWIHEDCTVATIRWSDDLQSWYWLPFVSWALLHRDIRRTVAGRG